MRKESKISLYKIETHNLNQAAAHLRENLSQHDYAVFYLWNHQITLPPAEDFLSPPEQSELAKISSEERRLQFLVSRWALKSLLAELLSLPLTEISFQRGDSGKPYLLESLSNNYSKKTNALKLDFNFSHTADVTILGIAQGVQIGVDAEKMEERKNFLSLAQKYFAKNEIEWIQEVKNQQEQKTRFFRLWSLKEAIIKTTGGGVFHNLHDFSLQEEQGTLKIISSLEPWSLSSQWQLFELNHITSHFCALALYKK